MKIIVDEQTREILGAAIPGTGGDKAIHSILVMVLMSRWRTADTAH
jgi:pyruvate/2-oxoglutarate dehydrogenase complex dihydrolipoamide dehydrogenase (E3) component